jgi:hypothetical protein
MRYLTNADKTQRNSGLPPGETNSTADGRHTGHPIVRAFRVAAPAAADTGDRARARDLRCRRPRSRIAASNGSASASGSAPSACSSEMTPSRSAKASICHRPSASRAAWAATGTVQRDASFVAAHVLNWPKSIGRSPWSFGGATRATAFNPRSYTQRDPAGGRAARPRRLARCRDCLSGACGHRSTAPRWRGRVRVEVTQYAGISVSGPSASPALFCLLADDSPEDGIFLPMRPARWCRGRDLHSRGVQSPAVGRGDLSGRSGRPSRAAATDTLAAARSR